MSRTLSPLCCDSLSFISPFPHTGLNSQTRCDHHWTTRSLATDQTRNLDSEAIGRLLSLALEHLLRSTAGRLLWPSRRASIRRPAPPLREPR